MLDNKNIRLVCVDFHDRIYLHFLFLSFLHIHRGLALLLLSWASFVFRSFNALPRPANLHGGSPINMLLSRRTGHLCPILQRALPPRCRSCLLLLGVALHPPLPDSGGATGPGASSLIDVFLHGVVVSGAPTRYSAMLRS